MSNVYKDQARDLANIPILQRDVIACVHLEDKEDKYFWDALLQSQRSGTYHYITQSKSQSGNETSGSSQCLKFRPYLSNKFFIGIDSDLHYLLHEPDLDAAHFVCQTYTYSWENHYCEAKNLQKRFSSICPDEAAKFDFESFLSLYSRTVYKPLILLLHCIRNGKKEFGQKTFRECLHIQWNHHDLANNGEAIANKLAMNFESYMNAQFAKAVDLEAEMTYCMRLNVTEQNAYLHVRGHELYNLVVSIGRLLYKPFKEEIMTNRLPSFNYWQIEKVAGDINQIVNV